MKKFLIALLLLASSTLHCEEVTPNLMAGAFSGTTITNVCGGNTGGTKPAYLANTGIICWGYVQATVAQTVAINAALRNTGVQVSGYNYSWDYYNSDYHSGTLLANVSLTNSKNEYLERYYYILNTDTNMKWTTISGSQNFKQSYPIEALGDLTVSFTGKDSRYWAGWYGPAIRNVNVGLKYTAAPIDPCVTDVLSSPTCPGYQQAYLTQQCSINSLYSPECPGYQQAYLTQQCSINELYDQKCPNYSIAYAKKSVLEQNTVKQVETKLAQTNIVTEIMPEVNTITSTISVSPASPISVIKSPETLSQIQPQQLLTTQQPQKILEERKPEGQMASKLEKNIDSSSKNDKNKMKETVTKIQKEITKEIKEASSIEAQIASQGLVLSSMNYVPEFDAYKNAFIPDTNALLMVKQYGKPVIDNQSAQRRLNFASEMKWQQIVDSQYQLGK